MDVFCTIVNLKFTLISVKNFCTKLEANLLEAYASIVKSDDSVC